MPAVSLRLGGGQAARRPPVRILRRTTPGEKQGCGAAGAFLQRDPWAAASAPRPRPGPGVHPFRGEGGGSPAAGVSALAARCARCVFVWLLRAGSSLFTGESHPETQALFLSGLSQVEESIKPPDQGKGRQSGAQTSSREARAATPVRRTDARPGHARALAVRLPLRRAAPAQRPGHLQEGR